MRLPAIAEKAHPIYDITRKLVVLATGHEAMSQFGKSIRHNALTTVTTHDNRASVGTGACASLIGPLSQAMVPTDRGK